MELDNPNFSTCSRHPSQILTGVCSLCLAERLAGVDSIAVAVSSRESEIVEVEPVTGGGQSSRRVRKTLLSLFQLDDDQSSNPYVVEKIDEGGGEGEGEMMKDRGGGFRLGSVFSSRWKVRRSASQRVGGGQSEGKQSSGHSWEVPRHSWDGGSVVSKAFTCSFACLEEQQDRSRRGVEPVPSVVDKGVDVREIDSVVSTQENRVQADVNRRKSRRWSRVWDWSVTSPFRDLAKKRGHVLERSLSESWREGGRSKPVESTEPTNRIRLSTNGHTSARPSQSLNRSVNAVNGDLSNFSLDQQKKKEYRFGRSRSVHYSSPGNFDNGLLRFYLTPLRSSRRNAAKGRRRSSHSFARGILGFR